MNTSYGDYDPYSDRAMQGLPEAPFGGEREVSHGEDRISFRQAVSSLAAHISNQKGGVPMPHIHRGSSNYYVDAEESYWQRGDISGRAVAVIRRSGVRMLSETL